MEVRDGGAGVEFVDAKGTVVATLAGGVAYDAAFPGAGASTGVSVHVVATVTPNTPAIATPPSPTTTSPDTASPGTTLPGDGVPTTTIPAAGVPTTTIPVDTTTTVVAAGTEPVPTEAAAYAEVPATNLVSVEVSISKDWLGAKERKAPITIDPTVFTANAYDNFDTYVATSAPTTVLGTSPYIAVGSNDGVNANRGLFYFNTSTIPTGTGVQVVSADLSLYNMYSPSCTTRSLNLWGLFTPPTITDQVTWNSQPPLDTATGATTSAAFAKGATGCVAGRVSLDATRLARHWVTEAAPNYGIGLLAPNETDASNYRVFYSAQSGTLLAPILTITYNRLPTVATPVAPVNGTVLVNDSPSLQVNVATDVDVNLSGQHDVVQYWFRIGTGLNVEGGHGIDSGWLTPGAPGAPACPVGTPAGRVCWSVPPGALSEGVYFWHAFTWDGVTDGSFTVPPNDVDTGKHFLSIKLRLGADGSAPTDTIGPVQVNLASGNATLSHASPRFPTQGGDVGVNVAYNSAARSNGLVGEYYSGTAFPTPSTTPVITRTDPSVAFYWGTDTAPGPGLGVDGYLVRWTGNVTVPAAGSYTFYAATTDGVKVYFDGSSTAAIDTWTLTETSANRVVTASPMTLAAGAKIPVKIEYRDQTGGASVTLGALAPTGPSGAIQNLVLPPSWFTAPAAGPLPTGWTLSAPALSYTSARIFEHGVTLTDPAGGLHTYAWTGSGYTPPSDEDGVLARDADGRLSLAATDGMTYVFDAGGDLAAATSALDDVDQASPKYLWRSFPRDGDETKPSISRMEAISDPVAGRQMTLRYAGFNPALPCPNAPTDPNLAAAPSGKLCQVDNWDGTYTRLWYNPNGQLAKVVEDPTPAPGNPLAAATDYGYDTVTGKLNSVRDPLANDAVAVPAISATHVHDDNTSRTIITYTNGRATHVTLPVPYDGTTGVQPDPPGRGYDYLPDGVTLVQVDFPDASLKPNGFNRKVKYDLAGRVSADFDATANADWKATNFFWDEGDRLTAQLGPADTEALRRRSTTIYDGDATRVQRTGRVSDTYGPAPSSCFGGDGRSNGSCTIPPPHTATEFDRVDGVLATGLAVSAWGNNKLQGPPKSRSQAAPDANGVLVAAGLDAGVSSVRYTGEINLATVGTYGFSLTAAGSARLFVDDTVVADASAGGTAAGSLTIANTTPPALPATGWHRFRIDFVAVTGTTPRLEVAWTPNASSRSLVAADLGPRFANPTKSTREDNLGVPALVTATTYETLSDGVVKHDIIDPGNTGQLNLVTTSGNEAPGAGRFRRPTSLTLPANVPTNIGDTPDPRKSTVYGYYTAYVPGPPSIPAEMNAAVADCGRLSGINQGGRVHTTTALGLTRFDGHPRSGAKPPKGCPKWRPWQARSPAGVARSPRSSRPRSSRWSASPATAPVAWPGRWASPRRRCGSGCGRPSATTVCAPRD